MRFPEVLTQARKARGLSQEELAIKVGVSRQAVSKWETGDASPDLSRLLALADALEMDLDDLCGRERAPHSGGSSVPAGGSTAAPADSQTASSHRRRSWFLPALCGFLLATLLAGGAWDWYRHQLGIVPAEETPVAPLPEELTVSGVSFRPQDSNTVSVFCTPSITNDGYTYQITFANADGSPITTVEVPCTGGICTGTVVLSDRHADSVILTVRDGSSSRNVPLAENLTFDELDASWYPLT